jgi:glycosyltransferase involved in cell wall biosynthesis
MRLGVVAAADPLDLRTWSGTPYFMTKALESEFPRVFAVRRPWPAWFQLLRRTGRKVSAGRIDIAWSYVLAQWGAKHIARQLQAERVDVVLAIGSAPFSAFLAAELPTVHVSDATVPLMRDYYSEFSRLPKLLAESAYELDRMSVLKSRASLFSTEWAAQSAILDYGANPDHVHAIPWGPNVASQKTTFKESLRSDTCHLVFIGVDWERKGGSLAIEAAMRLAAAGRPVKLHILGANPKMREQSDIVVVHGFINKGTSEGREQFDKIMSQASFLFVPTRQDCSPMVFAEANSYGVPVISTRTGGVADVIREGVNGHLLSPDAKSSDYAELIWEIWSDIPRYSRLRRSAWGRFDQSLNWNSWLSATVPIVRAAAKCRQNSPSL